jgi:hypothetical protein
VFELKTGEAATVCRVQAGDTVFALRAVEARCILLED